MSPSITAFVTFACLFAGTDYGIGDSICDSASACLEEDGIYICRVAAGLRKNLRRQRSKSMNRYSHAMTCLKMNVLTLHPVFCRGYIDRNFEWEFESA